MTRGALRSGGTLAVLAVAALAYFALERAPSSSPPATGPVSGEERILEAFAKRRSNEWVEARGVVERLLPDDDVGSRHQRFIVKLSSGHTLLVSHNIDLADRVENLRIGDPVSFRGEYEWNEKGGVVHWTHHDPDGRLPGGWLRHQGRHYE